MCHSPLPLVWIGLKGEVRAICLSCWQKRSLEAPTNRFPFVWEKSNNGKLVAKALEKSWSTSISRENDHHLKSVFVFPPIFWPFIYIVFFCLTRTHCRSLQLEVKGSVIPSLLSVKPLYIRDPRCSKKETWGSSELIGRGALRKRPGAGPLAESRMHVEQPTGLLSQSFS